MTDTIYTVYKITNVVNNKIYIGVHNQPIDKPLYNYMGGGKVIKRAIDKYGEDKFFKKITHTFDNKIDAYELEKYIVDKEFIERTDTYNIKLGGDGGFDHLNSKAGIEKRKKGIAVWRMLGTKAYMEKIKNDPLFYRSRCNHLSNISKLGRSAQKILYPEGIFKGKKHKEETKKKIGKANSIHQKGKGNSQYGTIWIYNMELKQSIKIGKTDIIPIGWIRGRKINF